MLQSVTQCCRVLQSTVTRTTKTGYLASIESTRKLLSLTCMCFIMSDDSRHTTKITRVLITDSRIQRRNRWRKHAGMSRNRWQGSSSFTPTSFVSCDGTAVVEPSHPSPSGSFGDNVDVRHSSALHYECRCAVVAFAKETNKREHWVSTSCNCRLVVNK